MTLIAFENGGPVFRDGKVGTGEACCCGICSCNWPRLLSVTVAGFPDGYYWASRNGGQPPEGGGFEPACGEGANAGDPAVRFGGVAVGQAGYQYSARYRDLNATFTAEYVEGSGCTCPQWYGDIEVVAVSGDDNLPAEECPTPQSAGMTITLCQQESYVNLIISAPGTEGGQQATATVTGISSGAISATQITAPGSGYAYLEVIRSAPTLSVQVNSTQGEDAAFSITLAETTDGNGDPVWAISAITVTNAGADYEIGDTAEIVVTDGETDWPAWVSLNLTRTEPTLSASVNTSTGSGADLAVVLSSYTDGNGDEVWAVDSITVINGGTGYDPADTVTISVFIGTEISAAAAALSVVAGVIDSVSVYSYGEYAHTDGTVAGLTVQDGGQYYKETVTDNVIVNTPAVTIVSNTGRDAAITATVEDDPLSENFGEVIALTIDNGGQKYAIEGQSWFLSFSGFGLYPLEGRRPGFEEGTVFLPVAGFACQGEDQSGESGYFSDRVELTGCGEALLSRTYSAYYYAEIFPGGVAADKMPAGAAYSLGSPPFRSGCTGLTVVDWGSGPMTVAISPA